MPTENPNPYQILIDQLLSLETSEEVVAFFAPDDTLLDRELLGALAGRQTTDPAQQQKLDWLSQVLAQLHGQKCLLIFVNTSGQTDASAYAQEYTYELATNDNFNRLQSLIAQYQQQPDSQNYLKERKALLATLAMQAFVTAEAWPEQRSMLVSGIDWLTHPAARGHLARLSDEYPGYSDYLKDMAQLIDRCQTRDAPQALDERDLHWLLHQVEQSEGPQKVPLLRQAIELTENGSPELWAALQLELGNALYQTQSENQTETLEAAITAYQSALTVYTSEQFPQQWAMAQNDLGNAYANRIRGERADNIEAAITAYQNALLVRTREQFPQDWAMTQNNLGAAYGARIRGERADNIEAAIEAYRNALTVRTRQQFPQDWAMTQNNLGAAYGDRIRGERAENIEAALAAYRNALTVRTREQFPQDWAMTQNNLGAAYGARIRGERADNIEAAIEAYRNALTVRTRQHFPQDWAMTQNNLGTAYRDRIRGERADNVEAAIEAYRNALTVYTREQFPQDWAATQNNLGIAYRARIRGERADNIEAAIEAYRNALTVYTREQFPENWATTRNNLGNAYGDRIRGERADNIEAAITAYRNALTVYTREGFPQDWAMTQNNLGAAYGARIRGERADNIEAAIEAYQNALTVRTREQFPQQWAMTQNNLGNVYGARIRGKRADNIEAALAAYRNALTVYTREQFPQDSTRTLNNMGDLYYAEKQWEDAKAAYEKAHQCLELVRGETLTHESRSWLARENAIMYACLIHCCLQLGKLGQALEYALAGKSRTLAEQLGAQRQGLDELLAQNPDLDADYRPIRQRRQELDELLTVLSLPPAGGHTRSEQETGQQKSERFERLLQLRRQINALTDDLLFRYPAMSALVPLPPISVGDMRQLAAGLGPLVEYVRHAAGWAAFVVSEQQVHHVPLAGDLMERIGEVLDRFILESEDGGTLFWRQDESVCQAQLRLLYDLLFAPLRPHLPAAGPLVVAPTQALYLAPFQALLGPQGRHLGQDYALSFVPSLATLRVLDEQRKHATGAAHANGQALLSVAHSGTGERHLPGVLPEARAIRAHFGRVVELLEDDARPERVIAEANRQPYEALHFNCHGGFDFDDPHASGLELAGTLTVNDIRVRLRLRGRPLVALSACQTGQTRPERGDEATGLSWSFLAAGAAAVVASQWSVPDYATRRLFEHFYQLRRQPGVSNAEALRRAMEKVRGMDAFASPHYWAGFQVMGLPIT